MMCVQEMPHGPNITHSIIDKHPKMKGRVSEYQMPEAVTMPDTVDWRTGGAVTFVKDQVSNCCFYTK